MLLFSPMSSWYYYIVRRTATADKTAVTSGHHLPVEKKILASCRLLGSVHRAHHRSDQMIAAVGRPRSGRRARLLASGFRLMTADLLSAQRSRNITSLAYRFF